VTVIYPLDLAIIVWGIVGTDKIRQQVLLCAKWEKYSNQALVITTVVFIPVPLIVLRLQGTWEVKEPGSTPYSIK
jgi:hypothetical protein